MRNSEDSFDNLLLFLKQTRGFDFSAYKKSTIERRIIKRMQMKEVSTWEEYIEYLEVHPQEFQHLFNTILINVTSFFRDRDTWDYLEHEVIPKIIQARGPDHPIRVWSAGCASGEEAYSVAILLAEQLGPEGYRDRVKIYATDVDDEALTQSRSAIYFPRDVQDIPAPLLQKYFEESAERFTVDREIRRAVVFGRHDLIQDAPISKVDLLICRNTLMYFNAEAQDRILSRFGFALAPDGYLVLGKAETLLSHHSVFVPSDLKRRVFVKDPGGNTRERNNVLFHNITESRHGVVEGHVRLKEALLDTSPVAEIVTDIQGKLYLTNAKARALFGLTQRDIGRPLQDLEVSYRPAEMRSAIEQAATRHRMIEIKEVQWTNHLGETVFLDVKVSPVLGEAKALLGVCIMWEDVTHFKRLQEELVSFNQELETAYEELQSTNEELQTTNEELQSTVEELETTNEELQSSNEELETMNEELQSTNEELETINEELRLRSEELNEANAFLEAILAGFSEGVVVVDSKLEVLAWNPKSEDLWGLRSEEVVGKHLLNLDIGLPIDSTRPFLKNVFNGSDGPHVADLEATNRRGKKIKVTVRVMPLPASDGKVKGAIIAIHDNGHSDLVRSG